MLLASFLRPEVDDEYVVEDRADEFAEFLVRGVIDVSVTVFFAPEGQDETVRATFVAVFFADVASPFVILDLPDLLLQIAKGVFDLFDLFAGRAFFELEGDDVT